MFKTLSATALSLSLAACASFKNVEEAPPTFSYEVNGNYVTLSSSDKRLGQHITDCKEVTELASLFNISPKVNENLAELMADNPNNGGLTKEQATKAAHGLIKAIKGAALECAK